MQKIILNFPGTVKRVSVKRVSDDVTALDGIDVPLWVCEHPRRGAVMSEIITVLLDLAKNVLYAYAIATLKVLVVALTHLDAKIGKLDAEIARWAKENEVARRLMSVPGIGPLIATAVAVLVPPSVLTACRSVLLSGASS
jgi:hypothetical protein